MAIGFNQVPVDTRVPFAYVEFDESGAIDEPGIQPYRALMVGTARSTGAAATREIVRIASAEDAARAWGIGSVLHQMAQAWFRVNITSELYGIALALPGGAAAQETTLTFAGAATAAGTVVLWIGDRRIAVPVASGATAAQVAASVNTAIAAIDDTGFTSAVAAAVVTLTAVAGGAWAALATAASPDGIPVQDSLGVDESLPPGVTLAVASATAASGEPDLATLWTALGDVQYNVIMSPYTSAAALASIETELASRWGPVRPIEGHYFSAARGTTALVTAKANGRNSRANCGKRQTACPQRRPNRDCGTRPLTRCAGPRTGPASGSFCSWKTWKRSVSARARNSAAAWAKRSCRNRGSRSSPPRPAGSNLRARSGRPWPACSPCRRSNP